MANIQKMTKTVSNKVNMEINRECREYKNNVDRDKSKYNYQVGVIRENERQYLHDRVEQSKHLTRDNIVHSFSVVLTLPKDYNGDQREFFTNAYYFLEKEFGRDNIVGSHVHLDETTPHMHTQVIPITDDNRLCAKDILTRDFMQHFHERLQEHLRARDPEHTINIVRDTKERERNLSLAEYKIQQKEKELAERTRDLRDNITEYNKQVQEINRAYDSMQRTYDYIDKVHHFCDRIGITEYAYHTHEYYANRGDRDHFAPEAHNPERTKEERDKIAERLEEQRREYEREQQRDRDNRDNRDRDR